MRRDRVTRLLMSGLLMGLALGPFAPAAPPQTPSALEREPDGWSDLLAEAGPSLKGWTRASIPPGRAVSPESQWSIEPRTGALICRGDGAHEWVRWDRELGDFIFHVEWRFVPEPGKKGYNSGIYARNSYDARIWHQAQTGDASGGFLFGETPVDGKLARVNFSKQVLDKRVRPAGEWNTFEITCKGKDMILWVNGAVTNEWHDCQAPRGFVGLEAEHWRIEFRNVRLKPL